MVTRYPNGFDDRDIISFKNAHGKIIKAVEVLTNDSNYLVKISAKLEVTMANYDADDYKEFNDDDSYVTPDFEID